MRILKNILYLFFACVLFCGQADAQSMTDLKKKQQTAQKEIRETSDKIKQTKKKTRKSLNSLNRITADIRAQERLVNKLMKEVADINLKIDVINKDIAENNKKLERLKNNYLKAIRQMRGRRNSVNKLSFLFSSESFHQAYRRMRYLKEFSDWRGKQSDEIKQIQQKLMEKKASLEKLQAEKNNKIMVINQTKLSLVSKKNEQSRIVQSLREEESELKQVLMDKEKEAKALDKKLNELIEEEERKAAERARVEAEKRRQEAERQAKIAEEKRKAEEERIRQEQLKQQKELERLQKEESKKAEKRRQEELKKRKKEIEKRQEELRKQEEELQKQREEEKRKIEEEKKAKYTMDNAEFKLSGSFASNQGNLPSPVIGKSRIVRQFGRHKHPLLQYVETDNPGIDIEAENGAEARAVFDGKVSAIFQKAGFNNIVMVRHGNYLTIYAGLEQIYVKTGDKLSAGEKIGRIFSDEEDDNRTLLHFEIRKERQKLNPELWLK